MHELRVYSIIMKPVLLKYVFQLIKTFCIIDMQAIENKVKHNQNSSARTDWFLMQPLRSEFDEHSKCNDQLRRHE